MNSTSTPLDDFPKQMMQAALDAIEKGTLDGVRMVWTFVRAFVFENWGTILLVLLGLFIIAVGKFLIFGRWGMLGSLMYRVIYLSGLFVAALVFGPDIFASAWIDIALAVFGIVCFEIVGHLLRKVGARTYR